MRNELIPKVLKEYRKRNHYSVKDVSIRLMEHDIDVAPKTIYGWGKRTGTADGGHTALTVRDIQNPGHPKLLRLRPAR